MEVIDVSGYTEEEKIEIARRHLLPKQIKRHALKKDQVKITRAALARLISWSVSYTHLDVYKRQV